MTLSEDLSHDVVVPSAGCHVELVSVRVWMDREIGVARAVAHNTPKKSAFCMAVTASVRCDDRWCVEGFNDLW